MKMYLILGGVALVLIAGGAWYWSTTQVLDDAEPMPSVESTDSSAETVTGAIGSVIAEETTPKAGTYTMAEVATHNNASSCWSVVGGVVYDLTAWVKKHPGGAQAILSICGKDGTQAFTGKHMGDQKPEAMLATFKIGVVTQ
jgi:cytochrome b involved in lipid metabolism